ncbi:MAG: hypothetical protein VX498_15490 [Myxococcota bacterium]|nr:hypothetical protein [Myxococcota bacterium]
MKPFKSWLVQSLLRIAAPCALLVLALLMACPGGGRSSDMIAGTIRTVRDQQEVPVAQAQVTVFPVTVDPELRGADEPPEAVKALRGLSLTKDSGYFKIEELSSEISFESYPLLRNWKYEVKIQVPGYYIYKGHFTYTRGGQELSIVLEEKAADVIDDAGVIEIDESAIQTGAIRRGN